MADNKQSSSSEAYFIALIVIAIIGYIVLKHNFHWITTLWIFIRKAEFFLVSWMPAWMPIWGDLELGDTSHWLNSIKPKNLHPDTMKNFDMHFAPYFAWLPAALLIALGIHRMRCKESMTSKHDMESLLKVSAKSFAPINSFVNHHPEKEDLLYDRRNPTTAANAKSMDPKDWAITSPPLGLELLAKKNRLYRQPIWDGSHEPGFSFDRDLAERAFSAQLKKHYKGVKEFSSTETRLYEFLTSRIEYDVVKMGDLTESMYHLITRPNKNTKDLFFQENNTPSVKSLFELLERNLQSSKKSRLLAKASPIKYARKFNAAHGASLCKQIEAERVFQCHAFVVTGFISLLELARASGVVASCEFLWLKAENRDLWYAMSSTGRRTPFVEAGGCFSHWLMEKMVERPLAQPEVTEAIDALYIALRLDEAEKKTPKQEGDFL